MQKNILLRTNFLICAILIIGFIMVSIVSYHSNSGALRKDIEHISTLTSESIYHQLDSFFAKPVNVSLTMANGNFLKQFLAKENEHIEDNDYIDQIQNFLYAYKEQYNYDSVFLISAKTNRYYHFDGLARILTPNASENIWYYNFLEEKSDFCINVDNDKSGADKITIFINCKINNSNGSTLGVVGVGISLQNLQELLKSYDEKYQIEALLIDEEGVIQISSKNASDTTTNLFENPSYSEFKDIILDKKTEWKTFWKDEHQDECFVAAQYIPNLKWHLLIENNTSQIRKQFEKQLLFGTVITIIIIITILYIVNKIISSYNNKLLKLTISQELEYQNLLKKATEGLYENIFELDITNGRACSENTKQYFESLGMSRDTPYQESLHVIADKQIKDEFVSGYLYTFSPDNVLNCYNNGIYDLYYDLMITNDGENYNWIRIQGRIFYFEAEQSIRLITYRKNITAEKEYENMAQCDPLTGLYNKKATKERISEILENTDKNCIHGLIMVDIDYFKNVNDTYGHIAGDYVINEFATKLKKHFRKTDICGRIGGDEFIVFLRDIPNKVWLTYQLECISAALREDIDINGQTCSVSASIGVAIYPEAGTDFNTLYNNADSALYKSKEKGRDCFTIYQSI